jgi:hypothetical protein
MNHIYKLTTILGRAQNLAMLAVTGEPIEQWLAEEVNGELSEFIAHLEGDTGSMDPEAIDPELAELAKQLKGE